MSSELLYSNRELRKLMIPLVIEQVLTALMGTVDTMMVAGVSSAAISGVSLVDSINKLIIFLFAALATGGTIICSQYLGHGNRDGSNKAGRQVLLSATVLSVIIMLLFLVINEWLLKLIFGTVDSDVMANAVSYFSITVFSYPFIAIFNAVAALYRAGGNSKLPMKISVACNLLNIAGNAFLIFGLNMGAAGAALSTTISQAVAAITILIMQCKPGQTIDVGKLTEIRPDFKMIWLVLSVGLPTGVENAMFQFGKLIVQTTVSTLGTVSIAANAMVVQLELFTSMPSLAVGTGLVTVAGQCIGAGKVDQARYYTKKLTVWSLVILIITNWLIFFATPLVTKVSGMEAQAAKMTFDVMLVISIIKPFLWSFAFTPANGMRAAGDVKYSMIVSSVSMWIFRVGLTTVLCRYMGVGLIGIWCGYFVDWFVRAIFMGIRFKGEKWHQHHLI